jgi:hypothetical protein
MAKRPKIGDVVRVTTREGAADAQVTHRHAEFGHLLRVLGPAATNKTPAAIAAQPTAFHVFLALGAACAQGLADVLGPAPIPPEDISFPLFRAPMRTPEGISGWWLWDGEREWRIGPLPPAQRSLPLREIVSAPLLVSRAHARWRPDSQV